MAVSYIKPAGGTPCNLLDLCYPVGTIYQTTDPAFSPAAAWGGTWERIKGRVLVGVDENDQDFAAPGKTGGAKAHSHEYAIRYGVYYASISGQNSDFALSAMNIDSNTPGERKNADSGFCAFNGCVGGSMTTVECGSVKSVARSGTENNVMPYYTVYVWRRMA